MAQTQSIDPNVQIDALARWSREIAAWIPALLLSYSLLIEPIINFGLYGGVEINGLVLGAESKSSALAQLFFPVLLTLSLLCMLFSKVRFSKRFLFIAAVGISYVALAILSSIWSAAPSNSLTYAAYFAILLVIAVSGPDAPVVSGLPALTVVLALAAFVWQYLVRPSQRGQAEPH